MTIQLYLGDCLDVMKSIPDKSVDAVITDPPYGAKNNGDYTRFSGGKNPSRNFNGVNRDKNTFAGIHGDDKPFDPTPFLDYPAVIMWGYQFYAQRLPLGTVLIWNKKRDNQLGVFLSDAELAWQKGGKGAYVYKHVWHGMDRETERGEKTLHPTQKPVALMRWCIERISREGDTILDPFMGSGTTGVACVQTGRNFIGIEIDPTYYAIAERRIAEAQAQPRLEML